MEAFTFFILLTYIFSFDKKKTLSFMDRQFTQAIKGFSILTVIWAHMAEQLNIGGVQWVAGIGVSLFLIISGYGLELSYENKGLSNFWKRRIFKLCLPFWICVAFECIFFKPQSFTAIARKILFINANWFLPYILVCYLIFYFIKIISEKLELKPKSETIIFIIIFCLWFVIESLFLCRHDMPFLRARQMISFPSGILIAKHKDRIVNCISTISLKTNLAYCSLCLTVGLFTLLITQLPQVKAMPFVFQNSLSLLTVFPLAIFVLILGATFIDCFKNRFLKYIGLFSYEIFLIHSYTLGIVNDSVKAIALFIILTVSLAVLLHCLINGVNNIERFNSSNSH